MPASVSQGPERLSSCQDLAPHFGPLSPAGGTHALLPGNRRRGALLPGAALTPPSHHRGAPEAGEVPTGLDALPAPGAPPLRQRLQLPWLAQVLPPGVPAPLHPPGERYGTTAWPPAPPLSWGSRHPSPPSLSPSLCCLHCHGAALHALLAASCPRLPRPAWGMWRGLGWGTWQGPTGVRQRGLAGAGFLALPQDTTGAASPLSPMPLGVAEKPGACPAAAPEGLFYPCSFPCLEDKDCLGAQKCCPLGCGPACLEPVQGKASAGAGWEHGRRRAPAHRGTAVEPLRAVDICHVPSIMGSWGGHTPLPLHQQLLAAARETQRRDTAAGHRECVDHGEGARSPRAGRAAGWGS